MSKATNLPTSKLPPMAAGQRYGRLVALAFVGVKNQKSVWRFQCDCGNCTEIYANAARRGNTVSCGCYHKETFNNQKHGLSRSPEYAVWSAMKNRCLNPNDKRYADYGGRGITVCERWLTFENFYMDMGPRPSAKHSIDRIKNDCGYSPNNCRWETDERQRLNQRRNRIVRYKGEETTLKEAVIRAGLNYKAVQRRLILGWSVERALSTPIAQPQSPQQAV